MDERRVEPTQLVVVEAKAGEATHSEVLDEDVGICEEPPQDRHPVRRLEVQAKRAFVAVDGQVVGRRPCPDIGRADPRGTPAARRIAFRRFDLDDVSAEVAQKHRAIRAGEDGGAVDHTEARKRTRRRSRSGSVHDA